MAGLFSKKFYYNITAIKKDITEITHDCFLGLHDGGFLTGPHRPPRLFPRGGFVRVRTIGVPEYF